MVIISRHPVGNLVLSPFLSKTGKGVYNWTFVIGIIGAALWVILSWFTKAAPLLKLEAEEDTAAESTQKVFTKSKEVARPRSMATTHVKPA